MNRNSGITNSLLPTFSYWINEIYLTFSIVNGDLRLTAGFSGLLEVYYNGWGFICDDGWNNVDANTICKILGHETVITTLTSRYNETTNYKLSYISCSGSETSILDCGYSLYSYCSADEHIYIECGPGRDNIYTIVSANNEGTNSLKSNNLIRKARSFTIFSKYLLRYKLKFSIYKTF